ncbi:hypothetical protein [Rhodococcus wratislaviensis]|nr:hypothetical protein [Rhodococcus wratislaviensis]
MKVEDPYEVDEHMAATRTNHGQQTAPEPQQQNRAPKGPNKRKHPADMTDREFAQYVVRAELNEREGTPITQLRKSLRVIVRDIQVRYEGSDYERITQGLRAIRDRANGVVGVPLVRLVEMEIDARSPRKNNGGRVAVRSVVSGGLPTLGHR